MGKRTRRFSLALDGPVESRPGVARRWAVARCAGLEFDYSSVNLPLLVSELVTNACVHGADPVTLHLEISDSKARVEVEDSVSEWPNMQSPSARDPGGRGLVIVEYLSHMWGVEETVAGGKVVWAEVIAEEPGSGKLKTVRRA